MSLPDLYEHVQPTNFDVQDGIYRVVGRNEETVTLLRVADSNGRRVHTGEVRTVKLEEFDGFAPAENPDGNRPLGDVLTSKLKMGYWSLRVFLQQLAAQPLSSLIAATLVLTGVFGDEILSFPDFVFTGLFLLGILILAYVGSGRLSV